MPCTAFLGIKRRIVTVDKTTIRTCTRRAGAVLTSQPGILTPRSPGKSALAVGIDVRAGAGLVIQYKT